MKNLEELTKLEINKEDDAYFSPSDRRWGIRGGRSEDKIPSCPLELFPHV